MKSPNLLQILKFDKGLSDLGTIYCAGAPRHPLTLRNSPCWRAAQMPKSDRLLATWFDYWYKSMIMEKTYLCPSSKMAIDSSLLGIINTDGTVQYIGQPIKVTSQFMELALKGRTPEKRFRFTTECRNCNCAQWKNEQCSVAPRLSELSNEDEIAKASIPECGIRSQCRWFQQQGTSICRVCQFVITDSRSE